jgi:two-component system, LytTR family, sensor kinase
MQLAASASLKSRERVWLGAIWLGIALFRATQTVLLMRSEGMHHAWPALFLTEFLQWAPWYLATPLVRSLGRRYPVRLRSVATLVMHLLACMSINLVSAAWSSGLDEWLNPMARPRHSEAFVPLWVDQVYSGLLLSLFLYAAILSFSYLVESRERLANQRIESARLSELLAKAQLESLRRQIEPHFLFNSLNAIAGLVREEKNKEAVTTIVALSELLRRAIGSPDRQEISLGDEIQFLVVYLEIQKVRFAEHLDVRVEVPQELYAYQVPRLILQPLVENAVKHGIGKRAHGGSIQIAASRSNRWLNLRVYNDGPPLSSDWDQAHSGIGIANVRARLQTLYGDRFQFTLRNQDCGVEALLSVPSRKG